MKLIAIILICCLALLCLLRCNDNEGKCTNLPSNSLTSINLYPNPASDTLIFQEEFECTAHIMKIQIVSVTEDLMISEEVNKKTSKVIVDVSSWRAGLYLATITFFNGQTMKKKIAVDH